jgi:DNA polymerase-3 subunit epsilon
MREIVLDTETTGLDPASGHRIVEIGCLELLNAIPTGQSFHVYLDPERDMPDEAFRVHGLSTEFLAGKPTFSAIGAEFLAFVAEARIVAHNAEFDLRFLNAELARLGAPSINLERVTDTLALARRKYPGASNSLDALCARYGIDASRRTKHGALLDAEILAEVYAELMGGRQATLGFAMAATARETAAGLLLKQRPEPLAPALTDEELREHEAFIESIGPKAMWRQYVVAEPVVSEAAAR